MGLGVAYSFYWPSSSFPTVTGALGRPLARRGTRCSLRFRAPIRWSPDCRCRDGPARLPDNGDPRYLEPYHWATSRIPVEFLKLNEAVASDESRPLSLDLRARTDTKLKELERIIQVRKAGKVAEAFEMVRTNRGKQEMDAIRRVARRLSELESSKLEDQVERSRRREDRARLLSMSGCGIIFVLLLFATRTIRRTGTQREQLILQLATSRAEINRSRDSAEATLKSIGDGVIATDERGRITLLNTVAEQLTGWNSHDAHGMMLDDVFCVVDESTRQPLESAVAKVLREGLAIGFANHSVLRSGMASTHLSITEAHPFVAGTGNCVEWYWSSATLLNASWRSGNSKIASASIIFVRAQPRADVALRC